MFFTGIWTISIPVWACRPKQALKAKPWCFPNPNQLALCLSLSRAWVQHCDKRDKEMSTWTKRKGGMEKCLEFCWNVVGYRWLSCDGKDTVIDKSERVSCSKSCIQIKQSVAGLFIFCINSPTLLSSIITLAVACGLSPELWYTVLGTTHFINESILND